MSGSEWSFYVERSGADRPSESEQYCYGKFGIADFIEGYNVPQPVRAALRRRIARALRVETRQVFLREKLEIILVLDHGQDDISALAAAAWKIHCVDSAATMCIAGEAVNQARESSRIVDQMLIAWESGAPHG